MKDKNISVYQQNIGISINELAEKVQRIAGSVTKKPLVSFRIKDSKTLRRKMVIEEKKDVLLIDDVYGIRVITESIEEAYEVLNKISHEFPGYIDHDYFKKIKPVPSIDGKVLRLLQFIAYKNEVPFEIQINTAKCHVVNESLHEGYHRRKYSS